MRSTSHDSGLSEAAPGSTLNSMTFDKLGFKSLNI